MATKKKTAKAAKKKTAAKRSSAPIKPTVKNTVKEPQPGTQSRELWDICDKLQAKLKRPPARFEYREALAKSKKAYNPDSASFQYFLWRKFHGVKGHATGIYPKPNEFTASARSVKRKEAKKKTAKKKTAKKAAKKKVAKKAPKKAAKKKVAKKATNKTAKKKPAAKKPVGSKTATSPKAKKKSSGKKAATGTSSAPTPPAPPTA